MWSRSCCLDQVPFSDHIMSNTKKYISSLALQIKESDIESANVTAKHNKRTCFIEICFASKELRQYFVSLEENFPNPIRVISKRDPRELYNRAKSLREHGFRVSYSGGRVFAVHIKSNNRIEVLDDKDIHLLVSNAINNQISKTEEKYLKFIQNFKKP